MSRLPELTPETMTSYQRRVHHLIESGPRGRVSGPFVALLHAPALAERWQAFGSVIRFDLSLPRRLVEIAVLVTARRMNSAFEWAMHEKIAAKEGVGLSTIRAIGAGLPPEEAPADERAVHDYSVELYETASVSAETHRRALEVCGPAGLVELTAVNGYYAMCAMMMNAHRLPQDEAPNLRLDKLE